MSLLPYIIEEYYPASCHQFGSGYPSDLWVSPVERSLLHSLSNTGNYLRSQLSHLDELEKHHFGHIGKDGFQVCLDVQHFQPNEISVKTENNSIVVNAKHEEKKDDHGYISREFTRRYELPKGFKIEDVTSSLSSDGVLSIKCPNAPAIEGSNVRQIEIQQTGPAKQSIKSNEEKKENVPNGK
ncbi:heat shock protein 26-like [Sitodiplosis mosellana]|uniref:heat shock protein 26-like n=1 Tax=Sitodiplosis mosellana TaxID=263140 RepID=UPI00244432D6|nr:heat shock protein 26-like [Sitodiplosis mosellana]